MKITEPIRKDFLKRSLAISAFTIVLIILLNMTKEKEVSASKYLVPGGLIYFTCHSYIYCDIAIKDLYNNRLHNTLAFCDMNIKIFYKS